MEPNKSLLRAMTQLSNQAEKLGEVARLARQAIEQSLRSSVPEPVKTSPIQFEHTDEDGDCLSIKAQHATSPEWHILRARGEVTEEGVAVRLRPDDLNRLAQYLDQYRTDGVYGVAAPAVDLDEFYCAGYAKGVPPSQRGCGHPRDSHGALGCNISLGAPWLPEQCPCERRSGR